MALPTGAFDAVERAAAQVAAERRRAARAGEIAARHEDLATTGPGSLREFHQAAAAANQRMQERHLVSAGIHAAHVARLRAVARMAMLTWAPADASADSMPRPGVQPKEPADHTTHDQLTGLPNRRQFAERLALAIENAEPGPLPRLAVCVVDVDFFGAINDRFGRGQGDRVLATVAHRLVEAAPSRLVARLGGDVFAVLLEGMASWDEASTLAATLVDAVSQPITVNGNQASISASVGIAHRDVPETDAADVLRSARVSLGWAKEEGRGRWVLFDRDRERAETARSALAAELPVAIERGEFTVEYQPVVSLADGHVAGLEALVRWRHPVHGVLGPDRFVDLAEERGLVGQIGEFVLAQACGDAVRWRRITPTPLFVSVNVTAHELEDHDLVRRVSAVLDETGLPAAGLHLEVLEGAIVRSSGRSVPSLRRLADLGVSIAIDDFGTGYSNLSYLRRLPVKIIKTDRSFLTDLCPPDQGPDDTGTEIYSTIVSLAQVLGLTVTAEGVETPVQAEWLQSLGVETAQGWYFGRPMATAELEAAIASATRGHASVGERPTSR